MVKREKKNVNSQGLGETLTAFLRIRHADDFPELPEQRDEGFFQPAQPGNARW